MLIVDAHLDLAYNAARGRDVRMRAEQQPLADREIATVGFPNLREGNVGLVCATIFCAPHGYGSHGYNNADEARQQALTQLHWYRQMISERHLRFVKNPVELPSAAGMRTEGDILPAILLLEGADAIRTPDDVQEWFDAGLRIVGLAWRRTRMGGGTGQPGPLTDEGKALVRELDRFGIIHDISHLAEEAFWQLLDLSTGPVIATHSNCRHFVPTDRQLSDDMIRAIAKRGGVIGMNFYDKFLMPPTEYGARRCDLTDLVRHIRHICDLTGNCDHVGLGSDMDGGLGRDQIPHEIVTASGLPRIVDALQSAGFNSEDVGKIMGGNWLGYFCRHLPAASAA